MGGLRRLTDAELPQDLHEGLEEPTGSVLRIFGHHPELWRAWGGFYWQVMRDGAVPMRLKEIVRLRIATLNGCSV
jgi:hypothetical protein